MKTRPPLSPSGTNRRELFNLSQAKSYMQTMLVGTGCVYAALGVAYPPLFLLGFQESLLFVFGVTSLAPHVLRRLR